MGATPAPSAPLPSGFVSLCPRRCCLRSRRDSCPYFPEVPSPLLSGFVPAPAPPFLAAVGRGRGCPAAEPGGVQGQRPPRAPGPPPAPAPVSPRRVRGSAHRARPRPPALIREPACCEFDPRWARLWL